MKQEDLQLINRRHSVSGVRSSPFSCSSPRTQSPVCVFPSCHETPQFPACFFSLKFTKSMDRRRTSARVTFAEEKFPQKSMNNVPSNTDKAQERSKNQFIQSSPRKTERC